MEGCSPSLAFFPRHHVIAMSSRGNIFCEGNLRGLASALRIEAAPATDRGFCFKQARTSARRRSTPGPSHLAEVRLDKLPNWTPILSATLRSHEGSHMAENEVGLAHI